MAAWPASLPQNPLFRGLSTNRIRNSIDFEVEVGESISRRRFTGRRKIVEITLPECTETQKDTFVTFYETTTVDGNDVFTWDDFETGDTDVNYVFVSTSTPRIEPLSVRGGNPTWKISFVVRRIY